MSKIEKEELLKDREGIILQLRQLSGALLYIDQKLKQIEENENKNKND